MHGYAPATRITRIPFRPFQQPRTHTLTLMPRFHIQAVQSDLVFGQHGATNRPDHTTTGIQCQKERPTGIAITGIHIQQIRIDAGQSPQCILRKQHHEDQVITEALVILDDVGHGTTAYQTTHVRTCLLPYIYLCTSHAFPSGHPHSPLGFRPPSTISTGLAGRLTGCTNVR